MWEEIESHGTYLSWLLHFKSTLVVYICHCFAALREIFTSYSGKFSSEYSLGEVTRDIILPPSEKEDIKEEVQEVKENIPEDEVERPSSQAVSLTEMQDAADEFFDVPEPSDSDQLENEWSSELSPELHFPVLIR